MTQRKVLRVHLLESCTEEAERHKQTKRLTDIRVWIQIAIAKAI